MKAFPSVKKVKVYAGKFGVIDEKEEIKEGMDLRDYFAAKAMKADIANWSVEAEKTREVGFWGYNQIAERAYNMADAMMKAREQK